MIFLVLDARAAELEKVTELCSTSLMSNEGHPRTVIMQVSAVLLSCECFFSLSSVDGEKLYHGFAMESSESKRSRQSNKDQCSDGCPCGTNEGQPNDINALCAAMLRAHGVKESLSAAYVSSYII